MQPSNNNRESYDVASISRVGSEKRVNHVRNAMQISQQQRPTGNFVKVFADIFLRHEIKGNIK
ncbi:MAG: hypothetical protein PHH14_06470 [Candidatus Margulisbacteria bacterium]|nr:hypothetical protein [Candidatus Margulisiibacteriota bacterium]